MNDTIVQEVRDIRASIAAEFGYDRTRIIAWAREQTKQRKEAKRDLGGNKASSPKEGAVAVGSSVVI